jgi:poly(hydroxyalkanoate) depolymerase family esterase
MALIDWRELYASNRAVIERAGGAPGDLPGAFASPISVTQQPARDRKRYALVHAPKDVRAGVPVPLICMLHGCTQDAASFAAATRMNAAADRHGFAVVYPQQERRDNQNCCWNWFQRGHQARGGGEPAEIAGIVQDLIDSGPGVDVDPGRVFVAGLSAGGAMAAIMAVTYPDLFAAAAVHSGLPYGSATDMIGAFAAMAGRGRNADKPGTVAHEAMGALARPVPLMVVHGGADATVASHNADRVLEQFMEANNLAAPEVCDFDPRRPTTTTRGQVDGGHAYTRSQWTDRRGALVHEYLKIDGMGHGWSGGAAGGSWTDPRGPDATEAVWRFFSHCG